MSRPVSLLALRTQVRLLADLGPDLTTGRYPQSRLNTTLNQSWQRGREIACLNGDGLLYLKQSTPATMTAGSLNTNTSFGTVPLPADCVSVRGVDVKFNTNDIEALELTSWGDRNNFRDVYNGMTGRPVGYCPYNIGVESLTTITPGALAIFPAPDQGYSYVIWYLPTWVDKVNDTDVFDGIAGHELWAVWDTVLQIAASDNDMQRVASIAQGERNKAEAMLTQRVNKITRTGPKQRRDVAGESRGRRALFLRRPS